MTGIASPNYVNGAHCDKYRDMPARIAGQYIEAQNDPDILSARNDIALCDARLADLIRRVDEGGGSAIWESLLKTDAAMKDALQPPTDEAAFKKCLIAMTATIKRGTADYAVWADIMDTIERRRKLSETEHKRLVAMQQMITSESAMFMIGAMSGMVKMSVERHVKNKKEVKAVLAEVANEMRMIAHGKNGRDG